MRIPALVTLRLLSLLLAATAQGFDVGDPSFSREGDKTERLEVFAEWMNRDIELEFDRLLIGTPASGPIGVTSTAPPSVGSDFDADVVYLRYTSYPTDLVALHFDVGFGGETSAGEQVVVLGGAVRGLLVENGPFQVTAQVDAHFVPEFRVRNAGFDSVLGTYTEQGEEDTYEYGFSLLGSMTAEWGEAGKLIFYLGPRLSAFRGEFSSVVDLHDTGDRLWLSGVAEQANLFGVVVGSRVEFNETWSARIEGRVGSESSLSTGVASSY